MARRDAVARDVTWMFAFGVLPGTGLMVGGGVIALRGGPDAPWWAILAVVLGVLGAFAMVHLVVRLMVIEANKRSRERMEEITKRSDEGLK